MKPKILYAVGGLIVYTVAMLVTVPAEPVLEWANPRLRAQGLSIAAAGLEGSVWSGRAASFSLNGVPLGGLHWQVSPWALMTGAIGGSFDVQPDGGFLKGDMRASSGEVRLTDLDARLSASALQSYLPPLPVQLDGALSARLKSVVMSAGGVPKQIDGTVVWNQARVTAPVAVPLGDLKAELTSNEQGNITGKIGDAGGPLHVSGQVIISRNGSYRLNLNLLPRPGASQDLQQALAMLGNPDAQGRYRIGYSGHF